MAAPALSVIALVSGGKDSFYSVLHCLANGHRVVALANLYPAGVQVGTAEDRQHGPPGSRGTGQSAGDSAGPEETDLNSFMYQTVGHQVVPLYAAATNLPLYRDQIRGTAVDQGLNYQNPRKALAASSSITNTEVAPALGPLASDSTRAAEDAFGAGERETSPADETESLVPLLRAVLRAHPEANALCTGAILSTYQRTRVESVALRLGLTPLSYLWQFTELPASISPPDSCQESGTLSSIDTIKQTTRHGRRKRERPSRDDARLLRDMATAGLEARIIKVASAGLDEDFLWENVASEQGVQRVKRAMSRFGAAGGRGSILGEGGEFETLVLDGPPSLFKGRITVPEEDRRVVREGGGCSWLCFRNAKVEMKAASEEAGEAQTSMSAAGIPKLLDARFEDTLWFLREASSSPSSSHSLGFVKPGPSHYADSQIPLRLVSTSRPTTSHETALSGSPIQSFYQEWCFIGRGGAVSSGIEDQTAAIVEQIRRCLDEHALPATVITNSVIVLRCMSDFPVVNQHYGSLFREPNPPSRVTISCGDALLPKDAAIAVYLTMLPDLQPHERRGLHVQSRSYWAPANIGPYSQAIAFPLLPTSRRQVESDDDDNDDSAPHDHTHTIDMPFAVSIAGQIPLIPASMTLPLPSAKSADDDSDELQITLALQHLWRVAAEMRVRWWTSAVAYFPAARSQEMMRRRALLAATAWKTAHLWPNADEDGDVEVGDSAADGDESDEEVGPDIWDRKYNPEFMTYGGADEEEPFPLPLPDWSVLKGVETDEDVIPGVKTQLAHLPPMFAAEVEELPRQAGVEWHALLGLAELRSGSVALHSKTGPKIKITMPNSEDEDSLQDLVFHHVVVESSRGVFVQTTASLRYPEIQDSSSWSAVTTEILAAASEAATSSVAELLSLPQTSSSSTPHTKQKITYVDILQVSGGQFVSQTGPLVACRSLWNSCGQRLSAVCVFETRVA